MRSDWDGKESIPVPVPPPGGSQPSPDGSRLLRTSDSAIVDSFGRGIGQLQVAGYRTYSLPAWGDDSRHLCWLRSADNAPISQVELAESLPGGDVRKVAVVGALARDQGSLGLAACAPLEDRAVITGSSYQSGVPGAGPKYLVTYAVRVVALSNGQTVHERQYSSNEPSTSTFVVASRDGKFLAENRLDGVVTIREIPSGLVLATLLDARVLGFSWTGRYAVLARRAGQAGLNPRAELLEWRAGRSLWSADVAAQWMLPRPGSDDVLIVVMSPTRFSDLLLVRPDGSSRKLADNAYVVQPCPCPGG
jgi:hypothetical protein